MRPAYARGAPFSALPPTTEFDVDIRFDAPNQDFVNFVLHETSRVDALIDGRRYDDVRLLADD